MGICCWIMAITRPNRVEKNVYIRVGKKSEMCNELSNIWRLLQEMERHDTLQLIPDSDERYEYIIDEKNGWKELTAELNETDVWTEFYDVEDLDIGLNLARRKVMDELQQKYNPLRGRS